MKYRILTLANEVFWIQEKGKFWGWNDIRVLDTSVLPTGKLLNTKVLTFSSLDAAETWIRKHATRPSQRVVKTVTF